MEKETVGGHSEYFRLMEVVGPSGKYQNIILALFCVLVFEVGCLSLGNPYYFAVAPYSNCPDPYRTASQCNNYVCSLPQQQRDQFLQPQISQLHTLGNQFGDYHCEKSDLISTAMGMFFVGSIVGYICTGSLVDNFGRKLAFNACLVLGAVGNFLVLLSPNLGLAGAGLFLMGFGLENSFNLCFYFLSEEFENKKRQVGGVLIQSCFCVGGLCTILWFYIFKDWKIIFWICYFLPLCVIIVLSFKYLRETPQFLIRRHSVEEIRQELRFIAKLNNREGEFENSQYTSEDALKRLKENYQAQQEVSQKKFFTFADLFRYKSLRTMSLLVGGVAFAVDFLYYAPLMLIEEFGFDFYVNGVIINVSELATYAVSFFLITKLHRKRLALYLFGISFFCSLVLYFLHSNTICEGNCWNFRTVMEIIIVFIMRFAVSLQFQVFLIYLTELYPIQVVGMGLSYSAVVGTLPNVFIPQLITLCDRYGINIMIFFCFISAIGLACSKFLRETKGSPPAQKIKEFGIKQTDRIQIELVEEAI